MLAAHPKRVSAFFLTEFEPKVSHLQTQWAAADAAQARFKAPHWSAGVGGVILQDTPRRALFVLELRRLLIQTLGLTPLTERRSEYVAAVKVALEKLGIERLKRIAFKAVAYLPMPLSHDEMVALLPGSYLPPKADLVGLVGNLEDALIQLHGTHRDMKLQMQITPMTAEQAKNSCMAIPNLEHFLENKLVDQGVREFREEVGTECLFLDIELSRLEVGLGEIHLFLSHSLEGAEVVSEAAVRHLQSLKAPR